MPINILSSRGLLTHIIATENTQTVMALVFGLENGKSIGIRHKDTYEGS
jgi:hypothetical protein